jgi:hypothetical protein
MGPEPTRIDVQVLHRAHVRCPKTRQCLLMAAVVTNQVTVARAS